MSGIRSSVSAAASLTDALTSCSKDFDDANVRLSFAGSDELAAQIRQGVKPDVYAAANTKLPDELAAEGLRREAGACSPPTSSCIAVPADDSDDRVDRRPRQQRRQARHRLRVRAGRLLHARRCSAELPRRPRRRRSWPTCAPRSRTSRASSASSRRARPTPASSTGPTSRPRALKAIDAAGRPAARGQVRCRRRRGRQGARARAAVPRRPDRRARAPTPCSKRGLRRRRDRVWFGVALAARARAGAGVPRRAGRRDLRRHARRASCSRALGEAGALDALWLSLQTTAAALAIIVVVGTPAAYLLATRRFRGRALVITLVELPLVLPPAVAGIALLAAIGPGSLDAGPARQTRRRGGARRSSPRRSTSARRQAAFAALDRSWLEASRTLGASEARTFARVAIPTAAPGLVAGGALASGRALGEFGATLMFAGSLAGRHPDRAAGDLRALLDRLRRRARAVRRARRGLRRDPAHGQAASGAGMLRIAAETHARRASQLDVALAVAAGECLALAGPSGAGKSSVLRIVAGLLRPQRGAVCVRRARVARHRARGRPAARASAAAATCSRTTRCSRTSRAWQNVAYGLTRRRAASAATARVALLERFGLGRPGRRAAAHAVGRRAPARRRRARAGASSPRRCCSTSRCRRSTPARARRRRASSRRSCTPPACPRCSSRTTSRRPRCSATASA